MRLLLVNYEFPPLGGGASNATWSIAQVLTKDGHTVSVLTSAFGKLRGFAEEGGVRVYRVPALRKSQDRSNIIQMCGFAVAASLASRRIAVTDDIEGCIAFFAVPAGPVALLLKRRPGIPYVVSLRGGDVPGHMPELDWYHWMLTPLRRAVLRGADAIVANSPYLARRSMEADPFPVRVIPNGVDGEYFSPSNAADRIANGPFRFLFAGRFRSEKNLDSLLTGLRSLSTRTTRPFVLDLAGDGPQREELARQAARLGLSERLKWYGWVNKETLRKLYRQADALVHPSFVEGMSNTILEAMACGLPVIASDIGGNNALVQDGQTGILFNLAEPAALAAAMAKLAREPELGRRMGARGRERVERDFSWESVATRYVELFSSREDVKHGRAI